MDEQTFRWVLAAHVLGVVGWAGGLVACLRLLSAHAGGAGRAAVDTARSTALAMDISATLAIATGVTMLVGVTPSAMQEPWMHAKLTVVVLGLLSMHGMVRARIKKARSGEAKPLAGFAMPVVVIAVAVIIALAVAQPM